MTLRTGKSGRYRYYTCASLRPAGQVCLPRPFVPMDKLDTLVTDRSDASLFAPERVRALLGGLLARQASRSETMRNVVTALQNKVADCESRLSRLYQAIENGIADASDPTLKDRLAALKSDRDQAQAAKTAPSPNCSRKPASPKTR